MSKKSAGIARDVPIAFEQLHTALNNYVTDPNASAEVTMSSVEDAWTEYEANSSGGCYPPTSSGIALMSWK